MSFPQLDLALFRSIAAATSFDELPDHELIWQQFDLVEPVPPSVSGRSPQQQQQQTRTASNSSNDHAATIAVLSKAAANCLHLLLMQQQTQQPNQVHTTATATSSSSSSTEQTSSPPSSWSMPTDPFRVSTVRMMLNMFARYTDDFWKALCSPSVAGDGMILLPVCVEQAVQDAGLVPLLSAAATALAAAAQWDDQQAQRKWRSITLKPLPAITLAGALIRLWDVLVDVITASSCSGAASVPGLLSHPQLSATIGPITQLALTILQTWDGKGETHLARNFCLPGPHPSDEEHYTKENPQNFPLNDLWVVGVHQAGKVADAIASACQREEANSPESGNSSSSAASRMHSALLSAPPAAPLALFHLVQTAAARSVPKRWSGDAMTPSSRTEFEAALALQQRSSGPPASRQQQQQMNQAYAQLLAGIGMHTIAAKPQPVVAYMDILSNFLLQSALQAVQQTALVRSQTDEKGAAFPPGVHAPLAQLLCSLLALCAPYGPDGSSVLSSGLELLQLVVSDAAKLQQQPGASSSSNSAAAAAGPSSSSRTTTTSSAGGRGRSRSSSSRKTATATAAATAAVPVPLELDAIAATMVGPLLTELGPVVKAHSAPLFSSEPFAPMQASDEASTLLPLFGCLLRDTLLAMTSQGAAAAVAAVLDSKEGVTATQTLEWVMRSSCVIVLPTQGSSCKCLSDDIGSLVSLCCQVVLGVVRALQSEGGGGEGGGGSSSSSVVRIPSTAAAKQLVSLLNSCLKLLNMLTCKQPAAEVPDGSVGGSSSNINSSATNSNRMSGQRSPTAAVKWQTCAAGAAVAACGARLAGSSTTSSSRRSSSSRMSDSDKLHTAGLSLVARGLLFVSRNIAQAGTDVATRDMGGIVGSILDNCSLLQAGLVQTPRHGRKSLPALQQQGQLLLDQLTAAEQEPEGQLSNAVASELEQWCRGAAGQLPASFGCNYTECMNLLGESELSVATRKCSGCNLAYFCSKECLAAYWKEHKEACKASKAAPK